jgi:hypothetical protein
MLRATEHHSIAVIIARVATRRMASPVAIELWIHDEHNLIYVHLHSRTAASLSALFRRGEHTFEVHTEAVVPLCHCAIA